jgi:hypothetical protein
MSLKWEWNALSLTAALMLPSACYEVLLTFPRWLTPSTQCGLASAKPYPFCEPVGATTVCPQCSFAISSQISDKPLSAHWFWRTASHSKYKLEAIKARENHARKSVVCKIFGLWSNTCKFFGLRRYQLLSIRNSPSRAPSNALRLGMMWRTIWSSNLHQNLRTRLGMRPVSCTKVMQTNCGGGA